MSTSLPAIKKLDDQFVPRRKRLEARRGSQIVLSETEFAAAIDLERRRTERSLKPFVLMLANFAGVSGNGTRTTKIQQLVSNLAALTRETDVTGWYEESVALGIIFTELGEAGREEILTSLRSRISDGIRKSLQPADAHAVTFSFHFFPEEVEKQEPRTDIFYPGSSDRKKSNGVAHSIKRAVDVSASGIGLLMLSPLLLLIAALVKLSSRGPVFFKQTRVGQFGKGFTFLKFRSMYVNNDASVHKEYVTRFIAGKAETQAEGGTDVPVYKLTKDSRITPIGRFLRKSSLDELPQLFNVLGGEMSLIGPRPPVPYEFECYDIWHKRRVVEVKPGITGLWQVNGRSRTSFDEMVRLDLRYARQWSLWLDLKILLQTPAAVIFGDGAY